MQGDHPLPAELLVGLVAARDQAFQEFSSLHINGDGRNPEHSPGGAVGPEAYSREDVEEAASLGGANGCGRTDQGSAVNPNALRRTFTLKQHHRGWLQKPRHVFVRVSKQFGNIKSLYLSAFDERTSPPFGQTGVAFFCLPWPLPPIPRCYSNFLNCSHSATLHDILNSVKLFYIHTRHI